MDKQILTICNIAFTARLSLCVLSMKALQTAQTSRGKTSMTHSLELTVSCTLLIWNWKKPRSAFGTPAAERTAHIAESPQVKSCGLFSTTA